MTASMRPVNVSNSFRYSLPASTPTNTSRRRSARSGLNRKVHSNATDKSIHYRERVSLWQCDFQTETESSFKYFLARA